jgi:hypothetical protein
MAEIVRFWLSKREACTDPVSEILRLAASGRLRGPASGCFRAPAFSQSPSAMQRRVPDAPARTMIDFRYESVWVGQLERPER